MKKQKKTIKEFSNWLNEKDRQNWEIERYVEGLLRESIERFIEETIEDAFKEWFSKEWQATKYKANYPDNPLEDFKKVLNQTQAKWLKENLSLKEPLWDWDKDKTTDNNG